LYSLSLLVSLPPTFKSGTAQHSTAQHSTAQHSTAQHSTAQHSTAQHSMDLGFGTKNQDIGNATAKALLQGTQAQEQALEAELAQYDRLLENDDALEDLRQKRLAKLQSQHAQHQKWKELGHGNYEELGGGQDARDVAKDFFEACKKSERLVVHFYRPTTRHCDIFHAHLEKLAQKHLETRFVKVNVQDCDHQGGGASFLVERLGVHVMPTLVLVKDRKAVHHIPGFDELGGTDDFSTNILACVLGNHGVLTPTDEEEIPEEFLKAKGGVNSLRIRKGARDGFHDDDADFD
jgi:hypothetical protein